MFSEILKLTKTYKNINRITQILNILAKHGFGQFIEQLNLSRLIPFRKRLKIFTQVEIIETTIAERLRRAFSDLGPSFIKLAQILSSRPDLITEKFAAEFAKLQDEVPPFPFEGVKETIEADLHLPIDQIFAKIDRTPIAAASVAQVHKAVLNDGTKVVVKVQRPNIRQTIETDINIMRLLASMMLRYIPGAEIFNPVGIVEEFAKTIKKELNFMEEAKNVQRFARNFKKVESIKIPILYPAYTSERVIVLERIEGIRINDVKSMERLGLDKGEIAENLVNAYFKMILEDGFFHADPHPGNLFIVDDGIIGIVDYGMAAWLTPDVMESIAGILIAIVNKDFESLIDEFISLGMVTEEVDIDRFRKEFLNDMMEILIPLYDTALAEINFAEYLDTITKLSLKHKLKIPSSLLLIDKCMLMVDSIVREIDKDFNFITASAPYTTMLIRKKYGPKKMYAKVGKNLSDLADSLIDTPKKLRVLIRKMINNEFIVKFNIIGVERLIRDFDRSTNRLSFSIVTASIIMSSAILTMSGIGAKVFDMPAIGTLGFIISFFLGIWLIISIIRSGRF
ncbi:MAG: AarF/ABC1/UbiB kinase family protein [Nitrospirae bacterium]|nr:AarF/ABC1/UbiB kinase family protein [Nitrospirota bacterium]MBF0535224.1 AarF/ABC1/UbiB kinase family protein [Nitrospirota bacterium]MBF0615296.1 AarF/ABC1/UbiB kinase family protein [Nitrospirota bacterium]